MVSSSQPYVEGFCHGNQTFWHFFIAQPSWAHKYKEKKRKTKTGSDLENTQSWKF